MRRDTSATRMRAGIAARAGAGLLAALLAAGGALPAGAQGGFAPAAFVDGRAVTSFDVEQRARLLGLAGPGGAAPEELALQSMIDDRLKRAAAEAGGIALPPEEIEAGLERFAQAQGTDLATLNRRLSRAGVTQAALREFVETELLWTSLIGRDYGPTVEVGQPEIDAEIELRGLDRTLSFEIGEISIPAATPAEGLRQAEAVLAEYRGGADWATLARRHSRAPTAGRGGRVGWMEQDRLPPPLVQALAALEPGEAAEPLEVPGGVVILTVFDRREEPREIDAEAREMIRRQIVERRLARRAEGRLMELKAEAYVERR